ncbi:hypothetical protein BCR34DRAFT_592567 [Clohesyomyces aquaticus]|uniref:Uncharacterized protein n=1 Tax=Clohesyomyces aquaticus TaxID=1231657 RepID=A0A1Y1YQW8_9PLEO|nr:hypothetical protein BCR34DRAFT_592567 [Clohesyomyces aquaticus]
MAAITCMLSHCAEGHNTTEVPLAYFRAHLEQIQQLSVWAAVATRLRLPPPAKTGASECRLPRLFSPIPASRIAYLGNDERRTKPDRCKRIPRTRNHITHHFSTAPLSRFLWTRHERGSRLKIAIDAIATIQLGHDGIYTLSSSIAFSDFPVRRHPRRPAVIGGWELVSGYVPTS